MMKKKRNFNVPFMEKESRIVFQIPVGFVKKFTKFGIASIEVANIIGITPAIPTFKGI